MLTRENLREFCMQQIGAEETFPFGPETAVYKVGGKIFAMIPLDREEICAVVKCDPVEVPLLREQYEAVTTADYMSKKHWNSVEANRDVPDALVCEMIADSYLIVRQKLTQKAQAALAVLDNETDE